MPIELVKECDVEQGFNFKQDVRSTFGYVNAFVFGDNNVAPDISVVEPLGSPTGVAPRGTGAGSDETSGTFTKAVVAVLTNVRWSTLPTDNITLGARISVANMQQLSMLVMRSLNRVVVTLSFVIDEYDLVGQKYFTSFKSYKGVAPGVTAPSGGGTGFGSDPASTPIHALLGRTGTEFGLRIGSQAESNPPGIKNHSLELTLSPPIAKTPQQILIQSSSQAKLIQPWGLPQS